MNFQNPPNRGFLSRATHSKNLAWERPVHSILTGSNTHVSPKKSLLLMPLLPPNMYILPPASAQPNAFLAGGPSRKSPTDPSIHARCLGPVTDDASAAEMRMHAARSRTSSFEQLPGDLWEVAARVLLGSPRRLMHADRHSCGTSHASAPGARNDKHSSNG